MFGLRPDITKSRQGQKSTSAQQQGQEGQQEPCQSPSNPPAAGHWGMFQTKVSGMRSAGTWPCWRSWTVLIHAACQLKDSKRRWEYSWKKSAINLAQSCKAIFLFAYNPLKVFFLSAMLLLLLCMTWLPIFYGKVKTCLNLIGQVPCRIHLHHGDFPNHHISTHRPFPLDYL